MLPNEDSFGNYVPALTAIPPATSPGSVCSGSAALTGSGAPVDASTDGTFYLDTDTGALYQYYGGAWHLVTSGVGNQEVFSGAGAPAITPTATSAIYIDTNNGSIYEWFASAWH